MEKSALIFDLDGTLIDSMPAWEDIDCEFLAENNIERPDWLTEIMKTLSFVQSADYFIEKFNLPLTRQQVMQRIRELVDKKYRFEIQLKPFVIDFLKIQHKKGVKMCVATATHKELATVALERLGIAQYFKFILTCQDVGCGKDEPDIYLKAVELLGTEIQETAIFEDALHCIKTAFSVGFYIVGIYDKSSDAESIEIRKYCNKYIESFEELV